MATYRNGYVPLDLLVSVGEGTDKYGRFEHLLTPATAVKHFALLGKAKARTGRTLSATAGYSCYRPMKYQQLYRDDLGIWAADPGTSSHGGELRGRDSLAIDYHNWADVYDGFGGQSAWFDDCRAAGFEPGYISRKNYFAVEEPWHVIDWNPYGTPAAGVKYGYNAIPQRRTIVDIQRRLGTTADGRLGFTDLTRLEAFQESKKLTPDRIWGPVTDAIAFPNGVAAGDWKPFNPEDDMPLTPEDIQKVAKAVWNFQIQPQDAAGKYIPGVTYPARGFLANTSAVTLDARDLAKQIRAELGPEITAELARLLTEK